MYCNRPTDYIYDKWNDIREKLPEEGSYNVTFGKNHIQIHHYEKDYWYPKFKGNHVSQGVVTHFIPLPVVPKSHQIKV